MDMMARIAKPRPVGTAQNIEIAKYMEACLKDLGYETSLEPFNCVVWDSGESYLSVDDNRFTIHVSPFSNSFFGTRKAVVAGSLEELDGLDCSDEVLFLTGELSKEPLQPKDYPFYYPEEHKAIIELLEAKKPAAIIAVTGGTLMSGLRPFHLIEDGNFHIPVACMGKEIYESIKEMMDNNEIEVSMESWNTKATAYQLIASKRVANPKGTIVVCAHMDTKYNTNGALDNASGVAAMLHAAKGFDNGSYDIDIVPFNTEEYYDPQGELVYLQKLKESGKEVSLVVNIDTVAHVGSKIAVASFNFDEKDQGELERVKISCCNIVDGEPWYAGDHAIFAFSGVNCVLVYASDLFEGCLSHTHCPKDTLEQVDENLIKNAAEFVCRLVNSYE